MKPPKKLDRRDVDIDVIFTQPQFLSVNLVHQAESSKGVRDSFVLDIAVNMRVNDLPHTTIAFLAQLERTNSLIMYADHHRSDTWHNKKFLYYDKRYLNEFPKFNVKDKKEAPACPCLITSEIMDSLSFNRQCYRQYEHGDFDGIMTGVKVAFGGHDPYVGATLDATIADTCNTRKYGRMTEAGMRFDRALKSSKFQDNSLRYAMFNELVYGDEQATNIIDQGVVDYLPVEHYTQYLASRYHKHGRVAYLDATNIDRRFDRRLLLLLGQEIRDVAVIKLTNQNVAQYTVAAPEGEWDLSRVFNATGGAYNIITLSGTEWSLDNIIQAVNNE